mgnify:CR=1 FL=1
MKINVLFLIACLWLFVDAGIAQNAPVTIAPVKTACPGTAVVVPVTVTGFNNIGAINLTLNYDPAVLTFVSGSNTSGFPGLFVGGATAGKVVVGGFNSAPTGVSKPDNTVLFTITFSYTGGTSALTWYDNGESCEYSGPQPDYNPLNDLPYSSYYSCGQVAPVLGVDFTALNLFPVVNQTVQFTDLTTGVPTGWSWSITPGNFIYVNGTNSGSQNPQVQFTSNGSFQVSLAATKGSCTITRTRNDFIHCGIIGLWTGITSSGWNIPSNWHNYMVPDSSVDVTIPASSVNWPVFNGDLTIGSQCRSLKVEGSASLMMVTGNLKILDSSP